MTCVQTSTLCSILNVRVNIICMKILYFTNVTLFFRFCLMQHSSVFVVLSGRFRMFCQTCCGLDTLRFTFFNIHCTVQQQFTGYSYIVWSMDQPQSASLLQIFALLSYEWSLWHSFNTALLQGVPPLKWNKRRVLQDWFNGVASVKLVTQGCGVTRLYVIRHHTLNDSKWGVSAQTCWKWNWDFMQSIRSWKFVQNQNFAQWPINCNQIVASCRTHLNYLLVLNVRGVKNL